MRNSSFHPLRLAVAALKIETGTQDRHALRRGKANGSTAKNEARARKPARRGDDSLAPQTAFTMAGRSSNC